jgi:hypothetical protein
MRQRYLAGISCTAGTRLLRITAGALVLPEAEEGFTPECGWPEFLERMWQLRFYLASINKVCAQTS